MAQGKFSLQLAIAIALSAGILAAPAHSLTEDLQKANKAVRKQHFEQAYSLYLSAAKAGNPDAQYQVGNMLLQGRGTDKNESTALAWLRKAADQNHAGAQFVLSQLLEDDPKQASAYLNAAASSGYTPALTQLKRTSNKPLNRVVSSFEKQWFGAARGDKLLQLKSLMDDKAKLSTLDSAGRNALFYAAEFNSQSALNWLIEQGIDVNLHDSNGLTAMQVAIERDHTNIVKRLLSAGSNPKQSFSNGDNLLHYAIRLKHFSNVQSLLSAGVPVNQQNKEGWTPLDLAEYQKATTLTATLKAHGAQKGSGWPKGRAPQDVSAISEQLQEGGHLAPVAAAITNNNKRVLKQLLKNSPSLVDRPFETGLTPLMLAVKQNKPEMLNALITLGADVNASDEKQTSALHIAARLGFSDMVRPLLAAGASPTQKDATQKDALMSAIREGRQEVSGLLLEHILEGGGNTHAMVKAKLKRDKTPLNQYLLLAVEHQARDVVSQLLPYSNDEPTTDQQGRNALWFAAKHSEPELIIALLKVGVSASQEDSLGQTPLIIAVEQGCLTCARNLLSASDRNHQTKSGNTALMLAAGSQNGLMAAWLIKNKVDIDARNQRGDTALMAAVNANDLKIAQQLISAKANITRKNKLGFTALDLAEQSSPAMVKLLKSNSVLGVF